MRTSSAERAAFRRAVVRLACARASCAWALASAARLDALTPLPVYVLAAMFGEDLTQGAGMVFLCCLVGALAWRRSLAP